MENSRKAFTIGCVVGFLLLAGIGIVVGIAFFARSDTTAGQPSSGVMPVTVTLTSPSSDTHYPVNTYISARAVAVVRESIPSFTLELWANGVLVETREVQPDSSGRASAEWQWVPAGEGEHTLLARARTPYGRIGTSNLVHVMVTEPVAGIVQVPAEEGDTPESVAERIQVPVDQIQPAPWDDEAGMWSISPPAPQPVDPSSPLAPGQPVWVPVIHRPPPSIIQYTPPSPPTGPTQPVESVDLSKVGGSWLDALSSADSPPVAPDLAASAQVCDVNLFITDHADNEKGFFVYRESPDGKTLQRVAVLAENGGALPLQFTDPGQQGHVTYMVASFSAAGETSSNPVSVLLDQTCSPEEVGDLQLIGETLILPRPVDLAYFYVSTDGQDWVRVPPDGFFALEGDRVDIWEHIGALQAPGPASQTELTIEAWGWVGTELHALGALQTTTTTKEGDLPLSGDTALTTCENGTYCPPSSRGVGWVTEATDGPEGIRVPYRDFEWETSVPNDGVVWQVSSSPFSSDYVENPPGLLASGEGYGGPEGYFQVGFESLFDEMPFDALPFDVYVRIVPVAGGQPIGAPSNTVVIHYQAIGPTWTPLPPDHDDLPEIYDVSIEEFNDEQFVDPNWWGCLLVEEDYYIAVISGFGVGGRYDLSDPDCADPAKSTCRASLTGSDAIDCDQNPNLSKCIFDKDLVYHAGHPACPPSWHPESKSDVEVILGGAWNAVTSSWDAVVDAIDRAKNEFVQGVVAALGEVGIDCSGKCEEYTRTILDVAVTYFTGIPPDLPESSQLLEEGIQYAIDLALAEAGIDCAALEDLTERQVCEKALEEAVAEAAAGMRDAYARSAAASHQSAACGVSAEAAHPFGREPWCAPPDLKARPIPEGTYRPATMAIEVNRRPDYPVKPGENEFYAIRLTFEVQNRNMANTYMYVNEAMAALRFPPNVPVTGDLYESQIVPIPQLEAGEDILIPVVLERSDYTFPGLLHQLQYNDYLGYKPGGPRVERAVQFSRACLRKGGDFYVRAEVVCASSFMGEWEPCGSYDVWLYSDFSGICSQFKPRP